MEMRDWERRGGRGMVRQGLARLCEARRGWRGMEMQGRVRNGAAMRGGPGVAWHDPA